MAPIKFEEHLKEKLEERSITPSASAWYKLEMRLGETAKSSKNKPIIWLGVAASIVGVLLVVSQFFNQNKHETMSPTIVVTPKVVKQDESIVEILVETEPENKEVENVTQQDSKKQLKNIIVKPDINEVAFSKEAVVDNGNQSAEIKNKLVEPAQTDLSFEGQKIQEVVAQVQHLKDKNKSVTDLEIDDLLKQAQKEIRLKQTYNSNTGVVDARMLLEDVEQELDQSFRDKAFKALKENFNFIKTAVARRND